MGCGASKSVSVITAQPIKPGNAQVKPSGGQQQQQQPGVGTPKKLPPIKAGASLHSEGATAAAGTSMEDEKAGKGGVAFSIAVDGGSGGGGACGGTVVMQPNSDIDRILRKPLPPRLRHLEPLDSVPVMTPEQLAEKLRKAEEKRERMLEKRRHSKVTKKSKARRELLKAQDFAGAAGAAAGKGGSGGVDLSASSGAGGNLESLQQKQASAEQKRLAQLAAVQEKQRLREERARAARERARLMKQEMLESELQIEKDEAGDESDTDSWLGDNDTSGQSRQQQQKHASAPPLGHQQQQQQQQQRDSSGYSSRDASSATDRISESNAGSRVQTGKTVSTVLEGELDNDFYD